MREINNDEIKETTPPETEDNNQWEDAEVSDNETSEQQNENSEVAETNDAETSDENSGWENAEVAETPDTNGVSEVTEPETPESNETDESGERESIRGQLLDIKKENPGEPQGSDFKDPQVLSL